MIFIYVLPSEHIQQATVNPDDHAEYKEIEITRRDRSYGGIISDHQIRVQKSMQLHEDFSKDFSKGTHIYLLNEVPESNLPHTL